MDTKSAYEVEFARDAAIERFEYKGFDIYSYRSLGHDIRYTFWYGSEDSEYVSGLASLDSAKKSIDRNKNDKEEDK